MPWIALFAAGVFEIVFASALKMGAGNPRSASMAIAVISLVASLALLTYALRSLPVGTAYAVWTGIGAIGTAIVGIFMFGDSYSLLKSTCLALIIAGVAGLRLAD
ncbi:multidrug efflux SMR transporter [Stenotrophomonas maltophilia]|nr:multidrug efflux SMR transporter [Stenotrophomonas maltophilia]